MDLTYMSPIIDVSVFVTEKGFAESPVPGSNLQDPATDPPAGWN